VEVALRACEGPPACGGDPADEASGRDLCAEDDPVKERVVAILVPGQQEVKRGGMGTGHESAASCRGRKESL